MVAKEELEGFRRDRYFARSWALLTQQEGWIKPVLVMAAAMLLPVVGWLGVMGYAAEWARLTAWGVNAAPKQKNVQVGECIKSGWRVFLVSLVWGICLALIGGLVARIPVIGGLWGIFAAFMQVVVTVAAVRATIYQKTTAGFGIEKIWEMVKHDAGGLLRVFGINVAALAIIGLVSAIALLSAFLASLDDLYYLIWIAEYMDESELGHYAISYVLELLRVLGPSLIVLTFVDSILSVVLTLLNYTAVGLWMRQFNVAAWGRSEDPLPPFIADPRDEWQAYAQPAEPQTPPQPEQPYAPYAAPTQEAAPAPQQPYAQPAPVAPVVYEPPVPEDSGAPAASVAPGEPVESVVTNPTAVAPETPVPPTETSPVVPEAESAPQQVAEAVAEAEPEPEPEVPVSPETASEPAPEVPVPPVEISPEPEPEAPVLPEPEPEAPAAPVDEAPAEAVPEPEAPVEPPAAEEPEPAAEPAPVEEPAPSTPDVIDLPPISVDPVAAPEPDPASDEPDNTED